MHLTCDSIALKCMYNHLMFTGKDGRRRKGVLVSCKTCGKEFATRIDQPGKYCSKLCQCLGSRNRSTLECTWCKRKFERIVSALKLSKSGLYFCCRNCKDDAQILGGIKEIMPDHFGKGNGQYTYRKTYKRLYRVNKLTCTRCGYNEKENLLALCICCHRALHNKQWS